MGQKSRTKTKYSVNGNDEINDHFDDVIASFWLPHATANNNYDTTQNIGTNDVNGNTVLLQ